MQEGDHAYVVIKNSKNKKIQYDPSFGISGTEHKGKKETREKRAADIWTGHGTWLITFKRYYERAIKANKLALKIKPDYAEAWDNIGNAYSKKREYDKAIDCFKEALEVFKEQGKDKYVEKVKENLEKAKRNTPS